MKSNLKILKAVSETDIDSSVEKTTKKTWKKNKNMEIRSKKIENFSLKKKVLSALLLNLLILLNLSVKNCPFYSWKRNP